LLFYAVIYCLFLLFNILVINNVPDKFKCPFLLLTSLSFYCWLSPCALLVLIFTIFTGYFYAIEISECPIDKNKDKILFRGILLNLLILVIFRYTGELIDLINFLSGLNISYNGETAFSIIGVSFFTFQNISYLIDCYLETFLPEKNILYFALYISFFPKILQGPIERASNLIPQFRKKKIPDYETLRNGLLLLFWGLIKKLLIADNLSVMVNNVFGNYTESTSFILILAIYCYCMQIYFDFSGYTDIARGSAKMLGIDLTDNFNNPYLAVSIQDFWKRWHISLSSWILDYLFKPLQMRCREYGNYGLTFSLLVTFFICGMWHGLRLNYILWGVYHGILISLSFLTNKKCLKFYKKYHINASLSYFIDVIITFHLICFSWLIFRVNNLYELYYISNKIFHDVFNLNIINTIGAGNNLGTSRIIYLLTLIIIFIEFISVKLNLKSLFDRQNIIIRWICYYSALFLIFKYYRQNMQFIYFQF